MNKYSERTAERWLDQAWSNQLVGDMLARPHPFPLHVERGKPSGEGVTATALGVADELGGRIVMIFMLITAKPQPCHATV